MNIRRMRERERDFEEKKLDLIINLILILFKIYQFGPQILKCSN